MSGFTGFQFLYTKNCTISCSESKASWGSKQHLKSKKWRLSLLKLAVVYTAQFTLEICMIWMCVKIAVAYDGLGEFVLKLIRLRIEIQIASCKAKLISHLCWKWWFHRLIWYSRSWCKAHFENGSWNVWEVCISPRPNLSFIFWSTSGLIMLYGVILTIVIHHPYPMEPYIMEHSSSLIHWFVWFCLLKFTW